MMMKKNKKPKVIVCQRGARRRYIVPRVLDELGMLEYLYTDSSKYSFLGRTATIITKVGINSGSIKSLVSRYPQNIEKAKIRSSDKLFFLSAFSRKKTTSFKWYYDTLGHVYEKWGVGQANIVYSMNTADIPFLIHAKNNGLKIIIDVFVSPLTDRILYKESLKHPEFNQVFNLKDIDDMHQRFEKVFDLADVLLCPSTWVASSCKELYPEISKKIIVSPYASSLKERKRKYSLNKDNPKIIFAGRDFFRKGLHYLAEASELIKSEFKDAEILVAGVSKHEGGHLKYSENIKFLGHVPMEQMQDLFESASVFVLPSLSEGQAAVVIEALSLGCPVVVTRECGVDIEDGEQGFYIPSRDSYAIYEKVKLILENNELSNKMSEKAISFSKIYSQEALSKRLDSICTQLASEI